MGRLGKSLEEKRKFMKKIQFMKNTEKPQIRLVKSE